ncbi:MAG TPA: RagB/SusD family nutrient uptake outer membrane protein [Sphingobacteriaceae bacterium]
MKLKYFLALIVLILSLSSCKDMLETTPLDSLSPKNFYETEAQVKSALAGVYDRLARPQMFSDQMLGRMGLDADEAYYASSTKIGVAVYAVSATDNNIAGNWQYSYEGINRANFLLENMDRAEMDQREKDAIKGEALFLRAFYHFLLVSKWGDIPLMIKAVKSADDVNAPRTPAKVVYEQIIKDMTEAEGLVRTAKQIGHSGRISKSAVRGILARVCLYMAGEPIKDESKYAEARKWALKVMNPDPEDGFQHELNPSFEDVFTKMARDEYDIKESIWELEFWGNGQGGYNETGRVGSNNGPKYTGTDPDYGYSYGWIQITGRYWCLYPNSKSLLSEDERREWSVAPYKTTGTPVVETPYTISQIYERNSGKWRRELEVSLPRSKNSGPINFPMLRYSDVLLMFAEADNRVNGSPTSEAIEAVNQVRRRAYGKNLPAESVKMITVSGGSKYTSAPVVSITGGGGTGATAKAFVSGGKVVRIKVLTEGSGYTTPPVVTLSGGGGSGTVITPLLSKRRTSQADLTASQTADFASFQGVIEDERSRELSFECLRKNDLIRWGKFLPNMKRVLDDFTDGDGEIPKASSGTAYGALSYENASIKDLLWPFAPDEMALNPGLKPQNPGY